MTRPPDAIEQLTCALGGLLLAGTAEGTRVIYDEHREPIRNTVVIALCRVCGEVDGHIDGCVVETAERVLRRVQGTES